MAQSFVNGTLPLSEYEKNTRILNEKIRILKSKDKSIITDNLLSAEDLYTKYRKKKITNNEYFYLLKKTLNKITVYSEKVIFDTRFGTFEHKRKIVKRQKGVAKYYKKIPEPEFRDF